MISATGNISGKYILGNGALLTGVVTTTSNINNGTSNISIDAPGSNATFSINGTSNVVVVSDTQVDVTGIISATGNISGDFILGNGYYLTGISAGSSYSDANVAAYLPTYTGNLAGGNITVYGTAYTDNIAATTGANNININSTVTFAGNANATSNVNVTGTVNGNLVGNTTGTHNGLVYSIDIRYLSWDFGTFTGTYTNPIQYLLDQAGGLDMGTILAPSSTNIDIGPIISTP